MIKDIYRDTSLTTLVSLCRETPGLYEKVASLEVDYNASNTLPDSAFAWPEERLFPIHNKDMALLSCHYRNKVASVPLSVDEALDKAAYLYDFERPVRKTVAVKVAEVKEPTYLLPELKKFPVSDLADAKFMGSYIAKNAHIMSYSHLTEAAHNLVEKTASLGGVVEDMPKVIYKYAGLTLANKELLEASIARRMDFAKTAEHKDAYASLCDVASKMDYNRSNLIKVASTLEQLDKLASLTRLYDKHILNPIESVFNTYTTFIPQTKIASDIFTPEMADTVTEDQVRNVLGDDVLNESRIGDKIDPAQLHAVINSLPTEMVQDFVGRL